MDEQPRLIDLIPRRLSVIGLLLVAGLGTVAALVALHAWMLQRAPVNGRFAALDLGGERGLGNWFCWLMLWAASATAVLVYTIRRYRMDDYQGHYRIWLWAATCWFLMSIDQAASLHEGWQQMMIQVTGTKLFGDGAVWWMVPYGFVLGAIGSRLLLDMRHCWLSSTALLLAGGCCGLAAATRLGWVLGEGDARTVMLKAGAEMAGGVFLLLAMGLHGRYVILDAQGLLPQRQPRQDLSFTLPDAAEAPRQSAAGNAWVGVDPPHVAPQPLWQRSTAVTPSAASPTMPSTAAANVRPTTSPSVAPATIPSVSRKLTKGERKALRQRLEQQRLLRQQQQRSGWGK